MASRTYSFKGVSFAFGSPVAGGFTSSGQVGLNKITVTMATERTHQDLAADGTVMVTYVSGDNGSVVIEVQQTSQIHSFLMAWYNALKLAADNNDVSNWAASAFSIISLQDGSQHVAAGVSPMKLPDKVYAQQGEKIAWTLMCANIQSTTQI